MTPPIPTLAAADEGFHAPGAEVFEWPAVIHLELFGVDLSINRVAIIIFLATAILLTLFVLAFRKPKLIPRGLQNLMEAGVDFIRNSIVNPILGNAGSKYLPYLVTVFFFIFSLNLMEIIPGINFPPTSRFSIPIFLAVISWMLFLAAGAKTHGGFGRYLLGVAVPSGVPKPLLLLIAPIEIISTIFVRPATLAIRLAANMIAGHLLLTVFFLGTDYLLFHRTLTIGFGAMSLAMSVALVGFELFVAALQAYIFTTLSAVYIAASLEKEH